MESSHILNPLYFHEIFLLRLLLHVVYIVPPQNHEINVGNVKARQVFQSGFTFSSESKKRYILNALYVAVCEILERFVYVNNIFFFSKIIVNVTGFPISLRQAKV